MNRASWTQKRYERILREWRENRRTFAETVRALVDMGYSIEQANQITART